MRKSTWIFGAATILTLVQLPTSTQAMIDFDSGMYYLDVDILVPAVIVTPDTPGLVSIVINKGFYEDLDEVVGARFGFSGIPAGCFILWAANPSTVVLGDPNTGQVAVQLPSCQPLQYDESVPVMTLIIAASTVVSQQQMRIVNGGLPDPEALPVFLSCDPTPVEHTTGGGVLFVNPYAVGAEPTSWSKIKSLYRD